MHPGAGSVSCSELWWSLERDRLTAVCDCEQWRVGHPGAPKYFQNLCVPQGIHSFVDWFARLVVCSHRLISVLTPLALTLDGLSLCSCDRALRGRAAEAGRERRTPHRIHGSWHAHISHQSRVRVHFLRTGMYFKQLSRV